MHALALLISFALPHRLAAVVGPRLSMRGPASAGAASTVSQADPALLLFFFVALGVLYALVLLVAVGAFRRAGRSRGGMHALGAVSRPAGAHRPLGAHPPRRDDVATGAATDAALDARAPVSWAGKAPSTRSTFEDDETWHPVVREVAGVGLVNWDTRTLRAFAGQPEVLQRLAFHRWRYQAGRCSEFTTAHASVAGTEAAATRENPPREPAAPARHGMPGAAPRRHNPRLSGPAQRTAPMSGVSSSQSN